ncbi:putative odorant receptor 85d [Anastrepha obliqua]|uniref:putative odorant receptor 85d n=1 Tax=Anastrepha obliqua TaxID=95512 RepID=UPI00240A00C2|nr:putative odorant receptor 85d [Anastrepha obliqua]
MSSKIVTFGAFINRANFWYKANGLVAYDDVYDDEPAEKSTKKGIAASRVRLRQLFCFITILNMHMELLSEIGFVVATFVENADFLQAATNLCYIGFVGMAVIKTWSNIRQRAQINVLLQKLYEIYPKHAADQLEYDLPRHLDQYKRISFIFVFIHFCGVWGYNIRPPINYLISKYWLQQGTWERALPYYSWAPFKWQDNWLYFPFYFLVVYASQASFAGYVANDLLLCATTAQLIMHFRKLANTIEQYKVGGSQSEVQVVQNQQDEKDLRFLCSVVFYHSKALELCELINEIFGTQTLVNFISTSFVMCFLAFQFVIGVPLDELIMLVLYMVCSLFQICMICSYGQELITTSENIGHAVYNHNWLVANIRYKKTMTMIIQRAQKPAMLRATSFVDVKMETVTDLLQLSYKFFALIRTMYVR